MVRLIILMLLCSMTTSATNYYVSNVGNDANNGTNTSTTWETLTKVNAASFVAGDSILFKRGDSWFGQLILKSGNSSSRIYYGAYNTGNKPILHLAVSLNSPEDWNNSSGNIWIPANSSLITEDIGNIIFNNESFVGVKKFSLETCTDQGNFYSNPTGDVLSLYSVGNPASVYTDIKICLSKPIVRNNDVSYVTLENLTIKYSGQAGVSPGHNSYYQSILNCDIGWIGGGDPNYIRNGFRMGNGIDFYNDTGNNLAEGCKIWECYDAGISNQSATNSVITQEYITYRNNVIWNCEYGYEFFLLDYSGNPSTTGTADYILIENNTFYNSGSGWSHAQRPDPTGYAIRIAETSGTITNFVIRNNIFDGATLALIRNYENGDARFTQNYNLFNASTIARTAWYVDYTNFTTYKSGTSWDANSIREVPVYANSGSLDFNPVLGSPAYSIYDPAGTTNYVGAYFGSYLPVITGGNVKHVGKIIKDNGKIIKGR